MGFLTIFYKYIIKSHKRRFISVQLGNGEGVWGGDGDALFSVVLNISRKPPPGASINSHKWRSSLFLSIWKWGGGVGGRQYLKQIKYQMLVVVDSNHILQIYNPAIFYCHRTSPCLLAIFKTNKILLNIIKYFPYVTLLHLIG